MRRVLAAAAVGAVTALTGCGVGMFVFEEVGTETGEVSEAGLAATAQSLGGTGVVQAFDEVRLIAMINDERGAAGLAPLQRYWDLDDDARRHSQVMIDANNLHHNPNLHTVAQPGVWSLLGENVGVGGSVDVLHPAFMSSPGHRANVLGDFNYIGVGALRAPTGSLWVTVVFMMSDLVGLEQGLAPFHDDEGSIHEADILAIYEAGITTGCNADGTRFCPNRTLTRAEMAVFLKRALSLPPASRDYFSDDTGAWYEDSVNRLAEAGITVGCGSGRYCPQHLVNRAQMAVFLDRALGLPSTGTNYFDDDDGAWYEASANRMAASGITYGCGGRRYCGGSALTRAQMASFLARALGL